MNTPKWLFTVLLLWILATIWSNSLEPAQTQLISSDISSAIQGEEGLQDPSLMSASGVTKIPVWIKNVWKALSFDYAWFDGWTIGMILRMVCVLFTIASLYVIGDLVIMIWRVVYAALGKFAG